MYGDYEIDCGCTVTEMDKIVGTYQHWTNMVGQCKPSGLQIKYNPIISPVKHTNKTKKYDFTLLRLHKDIVLTRTKQSPAMTVVDLLSQIGGLLGLLVGASVITLFEVFEFTAASCFQRIKSLVFKDKVIPVKLSV